MVQAGHGEQAAEVLRTGLGRRGLLRATAALGIAGAVGAPTAAAAKTRQLPILQPGIGPIKGAYLRTTPDTVRWGALPNRTATPVLTVSSGAVVTVDTVSHDNMWEADTNLRRRARPAPWPLPAPPIVHPR